jgi:hypothetical protein
MAVSSDEWKGELTQFLDRLPARPCLGPPPPSFCSVCGSINRPVASVCRFYPLRHERERGQTFIELPSRKRPDSFELEMDIEEEEDEEAESDTFEFTRPSGIVKVRGSLAAVPPANAEPPVEAEIYDAEVVEVIEEPEAPPAPRAEPPFQAPLKRPEDLAGVLMEERKPERKEEKRIERKEVKKGEKKEEKKEEERAGEIERELLEEQERKWRELEAVEKKPGHEMRAPEEPRKAAPKAPERTVLSREEEERLEREIEEELAKAGLHKDMEPQTSPTKMPASEKGPDSLISAERVIAPIYSQPLLKIISPEVEKPLTMELHGQPLPPPPPGYEGPLPPGVERKPAETPELPTAKESSPVSLIPITPSQPVKTAAGIERSASQVVDKKHLPPPPPPQLNETPPAPGQRRTGGLYGIFQKKQKEPIKQDDKEVDEELAKRLKNTDK